MKKTISMRVRQALAIVALCALSIGGAYAQSAAKALIDNTDLTAEQIVRKSLAIAGEICIYTNMNHTVEAL